jgi:hypothetical protein
MASKAIDDAVSNPIRSAPCLPLGTVSLSPTGNAPEERRSALTEPKEHADRVHLPRPVHRSQHRSDDPHKAAAALDRPRLWRVNGETSCLKPLDAPSFTEGGGEEVDVETGYEEEE